jgi:hypothetical protein
MEVQNNRVSLPLERRNRAAAVLARRFDIEGLHGLSERIKYSIEMRALYRGMGRDCLAAPFAEYLSSVEAMGVTLPTDVDVLN